MMASATDKQKDSLKEYMKKIKDIKLRVPEEYLQPIKDHLLEFLKSYDSGETLSKKHEFHPKF